MIKFSRFLKIVGFALSMVLVSACSPNDASANTVTVRLWDSNVASAYEKSFAKFSEQTGVKVKVIVVPWADYFTQLRTDLATNSADDIFWLNAGSFQDYAKSGLINPIAKEDFGDEFDNWDKSVVKQYSMDEKLWGIPQLSDPGIALFYNKELLEKYSVSDAEVKNLDWDPKANTDSLREVTQRLTRDKSDKTPKDASFQASNTKIFGFNAAFDLNAIVLNFLGSNCASWQTADEFTFANAKGLETLRYLHGLINQHHVAPLAVDTAPPAGGDTSRDLFLQGRMALFETGAYNLANIQAGANFEWGMAQIPAGPCGAVSVTNGIVAASNANSKNKQAQLEVLKWLGGAGASYMGENGAALTAVTTQRASYFDYWASQNVDVSPMIDVLSNGYVQPPQGANYGQAENAYLPFFNKYFATQDANDSLLLEAQRAANSEVNR